MHTTLASTSQQHATFETGWSSSCTVMQVSLPELSLKEFRDQYKASPGHRKCDAGASGQWREGLCNDVIYNHNKLR